MGKIEYLLPEEIEKRSFEIISQELLTRDIHLLEEEEMIIKRVIHTSADFDYAKTLHFSKRGRSHKEWRRYCNRYEYGPSWN